MATYRGFPSTNGPATAVTYSGNIIVGISFALKATSWFQGYWFWVANNGGTAPIQCALWSVTGTGAGTVVPNSEATSGNLTQGAWNYIPLNPPIPLAVSYDPNNSTHGSSYVAAIGVNGNFPSTASSFNSGDTYSAGITNGPLVFYSGPTGSKAAPYGNPQGSFSVGGSNPATTLPLGPDSGGDGATNFWADVQVSDTAPAGYSGTYMLWPNKFDANSSTGRDSAFAYDICTEVHLLQTCNLVRMWTYSPPGSGSLPTKASAWSIASGLIVASNTSPVWSGAAGSGWVSCPITGTLVAGAYRFGVFNINGGLGQWGATDNASDYWGAGAGNNGITFGPLYAPPISLASICYDYNSDDGSATPPFSDGTTRPGQSVFSQTPAGTDSFPQLAAYGADGHESQNYWVGPEVKLLSSGGLLTVFP